MSLMSLPSRGPISMGPGPIGLRGDLLGLMPLPRPPGLPPCMPPMGRGGVLLICSFLFGQFGGQGTVLSCLAPSKPVKPPRLDATIRESHSNETARVDDQSSSL